MKKNLLLTWTSLFVSVLFLQSSFAQNTPQWHLPDGVKARIGKGSPRDIALTPDGSQVAVATGNGVWIYNARTGAEVALLTGYTGSVDSVAYSPDSKTLASVDWEDMHLWDTRTQKRKATFKNKGGGVLAYSPNGKILAVGKSTQIHLLNAQTGEHKATLSGHENTVDHLTFSSDSRALASAAGWEEYTIRLWNTQTGEPKRTLTGHTASINGIAFSPTGNTLASAAGWDDYTIRLWNTNTGQNTRTIEQNANTLAYLPDGSELAFGTRRETGFLNPNTGQVKRTLPGHTAEVNQIVFSSNGSTMATQSWDDTVRLWNVGTGSHTHTLEGHFGFWSIALSPNGKTVATADRYGIFLWNVGNGRFNAAFGEGAYSNTLIYSPDGDTLAVEIWDDGYKVRLLNAHTGNVRRTLPVPGDSGILTLAFSPDGKMLAGANWENQIFVWKTNRLHQTLTGHTEGITALVFSPDSKTLASGSWDDTIRLWNPQNGKLQRTLSNRDDVLALAFSPDGKTLASGGWGQVRLWNVKNGNVQQTLNARGRSLTFSRDGKILASGGSGEIRLWNPQNSQLQRGLSGHSEDIEYLAFSRDGKTLVSSTWNDELFLWDMNALPKNTPEDVNFDGVVDVNDLVTVASSFGESVTKGASPNPDVNRDGVVDRKDVLRVIAVLEAAAGGPATDPRTPRQLTTDSLQHWIDRAKQLDNEDVTFQKGIRVLEALLATLKTVSVIPAETMLLPNYPNPFNPETWIPYQLAQDADVTLTIYDVKGQVVRILTLGHQPAGTYTGRTRAAYWDGRNSQGERVASGVYFYKLTAEEFTATRKMLILK